MTDAIIERTISWVLRTGVLLSAAIVAAGGACYLFQHGHEPEVYGTFAGQITAYRTLHGIVAAVLTGDCRALIQLGLLVLIATPLVRVAFSLVAFIMERDRTYTFVTLIVLAILTLSLFVSAA